MLKHDINFDYKLLLQSTQSERSSESNECLNEQFMNGSDSAKQDMIKAEENPAKEDGEEIIINEDIPEIEREIRISSNIKEEISKIETIGITGINQNIMSLWQQQMMGQHPPGSVNWGQAVIAAQLALLQYHSLSCIGQTLWPGQVHTLIEAEPSTFLSETLESVNPRPDKILCHPIVYIGNNQWQLKSSSSLKQNKNGIDKISPSVQSLSKSFPTNPVIDS